MPWFQHIRHIRNRHIVRYGRERIYLIKSHQKQSDINHCIGKCSSFRKTTSGADTCIQYKKDCFFFMPKFYPAAKYAETAIFLSL